MNLYRIFSDITSAVCDIHAMNQEKEINEKCKELFMLFDAFDAEYLKTGEQVNMRYKNYEDAIYRLGSEIRELKRK